MLKLRFMLWILNVVELIAEELFDWNGASGYEDRRVSWGRLQVVGKRLNYDVGQEIEKEKP